MTGLHADAAQQALLDAGYRQHHCPSEFCFSNERHFGDVLLQKQPGGYIINLYRLRPHWARDEGRDDQDVWHAVAHMRIGDDCFDIVLRFWNGDVSHLESFFANAWRAMATR